MRVCQTCAVCAASVCAVTAVCSAAAACSLTAGCIPAMSTGPLYTPRLLTVLCLRLALNEASNSKMNEYYVRFVSIEARYPLP